MGHRHAALPTQAQTLTYGGGVSDRRAVSVPVEAPVNLIYGGIPHVVLMATPADLEDLALGFSLTEGVIHAREEIRSITPREETGGIALDIELAGAALTRLLARRRAMSGRTGCGICGVESLDQLTLASHASFGGLRIAPDTIEAALNTLEAHQPLNHLTRAVHAAGWFDAQGEALLVREDVGRHNALDKMIGGALRAELDPRAGFALITSRCSFEMVEKAALFGASTLVAISAPTSLAIERARALGVRLVAVARRDGALNFTFPSDEGASA